MDDLLSIDSDLLGDDLFLKPQKKNKILFISDHQLAPSGVGVQARFLIEGLLKTGKYSFRCIGGAIKHQDYRTIKVNDDFIIKPVDGFGTQEMIRQLLLTEKPDALVIFTDPRQFIWLWEIEDEIHQVCPIAYWHVWDNDPYPVFNRPWYESTDLINCLSYKTYELVKPNFPEKTKYIPHSFPKNVFFELSAEEKKNLSVQNFGPRADWFKALWVNRNATRKLPADVLDAWKMFLDKLEKKHGHRKAVLIMHTDPNDPEGPNLLAVAERLGLQDNVWFSTDKLGFDRMNILHNLVDTTINVAKNEGFGLSTLISMQVGKPIVALKTGGQTRQVTDWRDGSTHGIALEPSKRCLVGSQLVPYIYEDFADNGEIADGLLKLFDMPEKEKRALGEKCKAYVEFEFAYEDMVNNWDTSLTECIENFKNKTAWDITPLGPNHSVKTQQAIPKATDGPVDILSKVSSPTGHKRISPSLTKKPTVSKNKKKKKNKKRK